MLGLHLEKFPIWSVLQNILLLRQTKEDMRLHMGLNNMQSLKPSMLSIYKPKAPSIKSLSEGYLITITALLLNFYHRIGSGGDLRKPLFPRPKAHLLHTKHTYQSLQVLF